MAASIDPEKHATGEGLAPLQFRDEDGDGVLTSRETGKLYRVFPQSDGSFFAPGLWPASFPSAEAAVEAYNQKYAARGANGEVLADDE